ncbi:MAG: NADH-quinone oxidoreductase subunit L, partial [FCB group bacterium]|nr:NADH-quinone oxidoreductase subunit L [FCB group bacterium]
MLNLLWLVPALPLAGALLLIAFGGAMERRTVAWVGAGSVGLSFLVALLCALSFGSTAPSYHFTQTLWTWMSVADLTPQNDVVGFSPDFGFYLDPISLVMILVVTGVGFLIHVYSTEYMQDDHGYARFFAYMNLFVASMLILVLADNLPLLYLGWEGVGLCSYLLIGFWYQEPANVRAANKAFIVTRVGDTAMALGLFLLFMHTGTLQIQPLLEDASARWTADPRIANIAALLLLGGAVGKSGQLPLQVWLPDAMAGPTPVSALIHAATMVTAGVYLIARMHVLYELAPAVQFLVAVIGAATLLLAGFAALAQRDIKRVLAYSTISQIGYMFLALGVDAWPAAMFHFMTHAFFKALLFMAAGAIIVSLHHEQDIFKMGGLRKRLPVVFWTFLIGAASLAALPLVTSGFYSKDAILWAALGPYGSPWLWLAGAIGAFITALYTFRLVFIVFYGEEKGHVSAKPGKAMHLPLVVLAFLATVAGFLEIPRTLGHVPTFNSFMILPETMAHVQADWLSFGIEAVQQIVVSVLALAGVFAAYELFVKRRATVERWAASPAGGAIHRLWASGWGFDALYDRLFVRPYEWLALGSRDDINGQVYRPCVGLSSAGG